MLRLYILLSFTLIYTSIIAQSDSIEKQLLTLEQGYFSIEDEVEKNQLLLQKFSLCCSNSYYYKKGFEELQRVDQNLLDSTSLSNFLWNASLNSLFNQEYYFALHYISKYENHSSDSSLSYLVLNFLINVKHNHNNAEEILDFIKAKDTNLECLSCLLKIDNFEIKRKRLKENASLLIPGSGLILNKNFFKGSTSMILNASTFFAVKYLLSNNAYLNAFAWGSNLIIKFYFGGANLTRKMVDFREKIEKQKLANQCELSIQDVLIKMNIQYK